MKTNYKILLFSIISLIIGIFIGKLIFSPLKSKADIGVTNPLDSLVVKYTEGRVYFSKNDNKWQISISATILNRSLKTTYKDFVFEVQYLSSTGTLLETREYVIYSYIQPLKEDFIHENIKENAPDGSCKLKMKLKKATIKE